MAGDLPRTTALALNHDARGILRVTLNRPHAKNALNRVMVAELGALFDALKQRSGIRAVVLVGAGGNFCAGGDMKEMLAGGAATGDGANGEDPVASSSAAFGQLLRLIEATPQVVIVAVEGVVLGGGMGLVCVSDVAIATRDACFGLPETTRGLPPAQIAPFLLDRIGLSQLRRLSLTGARFDGGQAQRLGLVHECVETAADLTVSVDRCVEQLLRCAPGANAATKKLLLAAAHASTSASLQTLALNTFVAAVRGGEATEGIAAFLQKRAPTWAR